MIAYLNYWIGPGPAALAAHAQVVDPYALRPQDLPRHRALLLPAHADQRHLLSLRQPLEAWLEAGGTLVCNGHVAHPFLRWLQPFRPLDYRGAQSLQVHRAAEHPVFAGVDAQDLTFRRGVAGFYARGGNPPPAQAQVLNVLGEQRLPVDWLLRLPGGGRLLVHSGNNLWMYAGGSDSAARVLPQLLAWIREDDA